MKKMTNSSGPLSGFKLIEIAGIGPTQLTGMLLADMGAEIIRIERLTEVDLGVAMPREFNLMNRSRGSASIDLKKPEGKNIVLRLCKQADALFEGFRPGVMERLGLGPEDCMSVNPALVYGRMTGWGQDGPLANSAGHDPNYISMSGVLNMIGEDKGPPVYPLNMIGDFGGGALYLAMGILAALLETSKSGKGQVVDTAMVDGVASMLTYFYGLQAAGVWNNKRGQNVLDGGAHFARSYETKDKHYVVVAALEARFYDELLDRLNIDDLDMREQQMDRARWPDFQKRLEKIFIRKTREEWCEIFSGSEACFSPVLSLGEACLHPHAIARNSYVEIAGIVQPAPAPRFDRTPAEVQNPPSKNGEQTELLLEDWGFSEQEIQELLEKKVISQFKED
jgi:alpha-methylacyl-CoA racemase